MWCTLLVYVNIRNALSFFEINSFFKHLVNRVMACIVDCYYAAVFYSTVIIGGLNLAVGLWFAICTASHL